MSPDVRSFGSVWTRGSCLDTAQGDGRGGVDRLLVPYQTHRYSPAARSSTERALLAAEAYRDPGSAARDRVIECFHQDVAAGRPRFSVMAACGRIAADLDGLCDTLAPEALQRLHEPEGRLGLLDGLAHRFLPANLRLRETPRFVELCRPIGLVDY